jgi:hypothetical protein
MPEHGFMFEPQSFARDLRAFNASGRNGQDPLELSDAANECSHGSLPTDRLRRCSCWGAQNAPALPVPVPDLRTEADRMTPEKAPFGYKADGVTPRKRPAPSPERIEKMRAARGKGKKKAAPKPVPKLPHNKGGEGFVERMVGEFEREIALITAARDAFIEAVST